MRGQRQVASFITWKIEDPRKMLLGAVEIEFTSPSSKSRKRNGVAPPPLSNWSLLEP